MNFLLVLFIINFVSTQKITKFTILHDSDLHARFEEVSETCGYCFDSLKNAKKCYGGFARTAHMKTRKAAKASGTPVIYLFAGDIYQGTEYYNIHKTSICIEFMNILAPDVITIGNHEFDDTLPNLEKFVRSVKTKVVVANLDFKKDIGTTKSTILTIKGTKIGVIGALDPRTRLLSAKNIGKTVFKDEIPCINEEAEKLKSQGVEIIIALTHSGYDRDKEIARYCPNVDLVVGGHSHSFLYNGTVDPIHPEGKRIEGPYPTYVGKVPIVHAYAFSKYMGKVDVTFSDGDLTEIKGSPILLDSKVEQDQDVLDVLEGYKKNLTFDFTVVGHTRVQLDGINECKIGECNLGNLVMDAMVYARAKELMKYTSFKYYTDTTIAFLNAGGIRASIDKKDNGEITRTDIDFILFKGNYGIISCYGEVIRRNLQHSAEQYGGSDLTSGILQMAGVLATYNVNKPNDQKLGEIYVLCAKCDTPEYSSLNDSAFYNVIIPDYLYIGGGGYNFTTAGYSKPPKKFYTFGGKTALELLEDYLMDHKIVYPGIEGRIIIDKSSGIEKLQMSTFLLITLLFNDSVL